MIAIIIILAAIFVAVDQYSKYLVVKNMFLGQSFDIIENFFSLTSHRNRGAAWGILQDSRLFFIVTTLIFLIVLFYYIFKEKQIRNLDVITYALIIGGAIGNFIDRLVRKEVVDFLDFKLIGYDFPIFNLADTFICIGVFLLLLKIYKSED